MVLLDHKDQLDHKVQPEQVLLVPVELQAHKDHKAQLVLLV